MYHSRLASSRSLSADHYQFGERSITGTHMTASALNDLSEKRQPIGTLPKNWQILKQSIKSDRFAVMKRTGIFIMKINYCDELLLCFRNATFGNRASWIGVSNAKNHLSRTGCSKFFYFQATICYWFAWIERI